MFKSLKEKLGGWLKKVTGKEEKTESADEKVAEPRPEDRISEAEAEEKPEAGAEKEPESAAKPEEKTAEIEKKEEKPEDKGEEIKEEKPAEAEEGIKLEEPVSEPKAFGGAAVIEPIDKLPEKKIKEFAPPEVERIIEEIAPPEKSTGEYVEGVNEKQEDFHKKKKGFFSSIKDKFVSKKISEEDFAELFDSLEMILLENNVALEAVDKLKEELHKEIVGRDIKKGEIEDFIRASLRGSIEKILVKPFDLVKEIEDNKDSPFVILFFGINGSGKTTTIAKIAYMLKEKGISNVLAAADTFRAASIEQLQMHGDRIGVKVIKHDYGADPSAVAFDAIKYAKQHGLKAILIDTAGRMHTKENLINEMQKINRIAKPDLKIFIGESITGNDAVEQARKFNEAIGIDGIILSKADVDEKGGTAISVGYVTGKPILYLGNGQDYKDLEMFDKEKLLGILGL